MEENYRLVEEDRSDPLTMTEEDTSGGSTKPELVDINVEASGMPEDTEEPVGSMYSPKKPKHGGLKETGPDTKTAWCGGKPRADYSGLEEENPTTIQPTQYRPNSISGQAKARWYRTMGLTTKLTRDGDILGFERDTIDHLEDHGLDTITYLKDQGDASKVISVVSNHGRFNHSKACKEANDVALIHFDEYDQANQKDAIKFLLNSLDTDLRKQLLESVYKEDCFIVYWLTLMRIVRSVSVDRYYRVMEEMKRRRVTNYPAQDIEQAASDWLANYQELNGANMYSHDITMHVLNSLLEAGGASEDFRYKIRAVKDDLEVELQEVRYLSYQAAHLHLLEKELDLKSILRMAKDRYRSLLDEGRWEPANHARDSKALNRNYGRVNSLVQSNAGAKFKGDCFNCGSPGHMKKDCPLLKTKHPQTGTRVLRIQVQVQSKHSRPPPKEEAWSKGTWAGTRSPKTGRERNQVCGWTEEVLVCKMQPMDHNPRHRNPQTKIRAQQEQRRREPRCQWSKSQL